MSKPVILTGLRANNDLHLGNYLGALLPMVDMANRRANDYVVNLMIADLHSFTTPINHSLLQEQIIQNLNAFVAAGLPIDHENVRIFRQSYVPAHSELTIILDSFTGVGEMNRMTQFKDKSAKLAADRISVGLFNYPVLMACDYLLYGAKYVPVGEDQSQHLEFGRDIAGRMNKQFGNLFVVPEPVRKQHEFFGKEQGLRIKDLADPSKKMSKSEASHKGVIFLSDELSIATKKIMTATTDSQASIKYDPINQPGISNLLQILALMENETLESITNKYKGQKSYGALKEAVADSVTKFLADFQNELAKVDEAKLKAKLEASEKTMNQIANQTLRKVQKAVGLR